MTGSLLLVDGGQCQAKNALWRMVCSHALIYRHLCLIMLRAYLLLCLQNTVFKIFRFFVFLHATRDISNKRNLIIPYDGVTSSIVQQSVKYHLQSKILMVHSIANAAEIGETPRQTRHW